MTQHSIICESCDTEYSIHTYDEDARIPHHCAFCGSDLPEDNVSSDEQEEEWERLTDEAFDDEEWKWEDKD